MAKKAKSLDEQAEELKAQLAEIEKKQKIITDEKKRVIADVIWNEMQRDEECMRTIMAMVDAGTVKNADRALFDLSKKERKSKNTSTSTNIER